SYLCPGVIRIGQHIGNVDDPAFEQGTSGSRSRVGLDRQAPDIVHELGGEAVRLGAKEHAADLPGYRAPLRLTKSGSRFDQRLQHRLEVEGRAADDLEHIGSGGLLLQRLPQLAEQPRVLDGDDGLAREVRDQLDLFFAERSNFLPIDRDRTEQLTFLEHRHDEKAPRSGRFDEVNQLGKTLDIGALCREIGNMDYVFCLDEAAERGVRKFAHVDHQISAQQVQISRRTMDRDRAKYSPLA